MSLPCAGGLRFHFIRLYCILTQILDIIYIHLCWNYLKISILTILTKCTINFSEVLWIMLYIVLERFDLIMNTYLFFYMFSENTNALHCRLWNYCFCSKSLLHKIGNLISSLKMKYWGNKKLFSWKQSFDFCFKDHKIIFSEKWISSPNNKMSIAIIFPSRK